MMQFLQNNRTLIGGVVVAGLLVWGYFMYFSGDDAGVLLSDSQVASPVSQELLLTLSNLRTIRLDETVFSDPIFVSFSDFRVVIPPEASGRRNPFAPIGTGGGLTPAAPAASTSTSSATSSPSGSTTTPVAQ